MSGFEIAGIVLASLPLIINALEHYAKGVETIDRWRKYEAGMASLILAVKTQRTIFMNTLEQLLTGIVRAEDMVDVLKDAGGEVWHRAGVDDHLKDRLRGSYVSYVENVQEMNKALNEMMGKLALDPDGKVQSKDLSRFEHERKRLKFSLKKSAYMEQVAQLEKLNSVLAQLTTQSRDLEPTRNNSRMRSSPNFVALQDVARTLYDALTCGLHCVGGCQGHTVKLRLEHRDSRVDNLGKYTPFHLVFNQRSKPQWREVDVRRIKEQAKRVAVESHGPAADTSPQQVQKRVRFGRVDNQDRSRCTTTTTTTTVVQQQTTFVLKASPMQIQSLCSTLASIPQPQPDSCIGYVLDTQQRKYGIYADPLAKSYQEPWTLLSLPQILSGQAIIGRRPLRMTRYDKLQLAVQISSSILQLYNTPWLDENWSKDNVHFISKPGSKPRALYEHPYVKGDFSSNCHNATTRPQPKRSRLIHNQTLFTLGVLLIEIWYGKPIGKLHTTDDLDCANTPGPDWCAADRLVSHELEYEAGRNYKEAVRRCLQCDFKCSDRSLENQDLQRAVFEEVVVPLEKTFQQFKGLSL